MIPVAPIDEPPAFDVACRKAGNTWLAAHVDAERPKDLWSPFRLALAAGFKDRCGYAGVYIASGHVDHHRAWKTHPELAYEWRNYRYVDGWINQSKSKLGAEVLDPFEVGDGWFEIDLPGLQMRVTDRVPKEFRARAEFTLDRLHLRDDERVLRHRRKWLEMYEQRRILIEGLDEVAPLIAAAVRRRDAAASLAT